MPKPIRIGPSWKEVFLGALISLVLGAIFGMFALVVRPVTTVKELPKEEERKPDAIYYIEGSRDGTKARTAEAKRKSFAGGESVTVNEDDLNTLAAPKPKTPPPKPKAKAKGKEEEKPPVPLTADAKVMPPNFRIHDGMMQIAFPTKVSLLGVDQSIVMLAEGGFSRQDGRVIFVPSSVSLGSCRLDRLPFIKMFLFQQVLALQTVPEDIATSWAKLASARVEGSELTLSMP